MAYAISVQQGGPVRSTAQALAFILFTVFLDAVGIGIIIPVIPALLQELVGGDLSSVVMYGGWLMVVFAGLQFVTAPILGNLSDYFGRRPVLLVSLAAYGADLVIMGVAPSIGWLFVGRALSGIFGATYAVAQAYIADTAPMEQRAKGFGWLGAAYGAGFVIGPAIGGILGNSDPRLPFFVAAALAGVNVIYGFFVLPESLSATNRRKFSLRRAHAVGSLRRMFRYPIVGGLLVALIFYNIANDANPATWTFITIEKFDWTPFDVGMSMTFVGVCIAVFQGGTVGPLVRRLGEHRTIFVALTLCAATYLGFSFAWAGWLMYAWTVPHAFSSIAGPTISSVLSKQVPPNQQGELQGALAALRSITHSIAPLMMTGLFSYFTRPAAPAYFPGAPFFAAAVLTVAALWLVMRTLRRAS